MDIKKAAVLFSLFLVFSEACFAQKKTLIYHDADGNVLTTNNYDVDVDGLPAKKIIFQGKEYRISSAFEEMAQRERQRNIDAAKKALLPPPKIGMRGIQVIKNSSWGYPDRKGLTESVSGRSEQWVYEKLGYLLFENDRLVSIHWYEK